jgi:hypothetical protein
MTGPASLGRRADAEAVGTAAPVAVAVRSGIQATELSRDVGVGRWPTLRPPSSASGY